MEAMQAARMWCEGRCFDPQTQAQARDIMQEPERMMACFGQELGFGTGGLRGILGVGTNRMNLYTVAKASQGLALYVRNHAGRAVAIAYDSRHGSRSFAERAAGVFAAHGLQVWLYDRLMPTPMLSFAVRALGCDAGVVITASHNPAQYNGYKVYGADGCQITEAAAQAITGQIGQVTYDALRWLTVAEAETAGLLRPVPGSVYEDFITRTLACRVLHPASGHPTRIVYTPLHGAGLEPVRSVLAQMPGIEVIEVMKQCEADGDFPTCPKPNPELRAALKLGLETAAQEGADVLIATDPDCDRVGVAARKRDGTYAVLTGNEVGLLLMDFILRQRAGLGKMPPHPMVVKTIVTTDLAFDVAAAYGVQVTEVLTGFKYIGEVIGSQEQAGTPENFLFGFEESCGYLAGTHVRDKDGVMAAMLVAELAQCQAEKGKTLNDALDALYGRYGFMEAKLLDFQMRGALPMQEMQALMKKLRTTPPERIDLDPITEIRDYANGLSGLPPSDVLTYVGKECKAIVRPSGTEPKLKVYLSVRVRDRAEGREHLTRMQTQVESWIGCVAEPEDP